MEKNDSLWVRWVRTNILKNKSLWEFNILLICYWTWRNIPLKSRKEFRMSVFQEIGNGEKASLWFDN